MFHRVAFILQLQNSFRVELNKVVQAFSVIQVIHISRRYGLLSTKAFSYSGQRYKNLIKDYLDESDRIFVKEVILVSNRCQWYNFDGPLPACCVKLTRNWGI